MVNVGTGTIGTRFISTEYPIEDGLEAGTNTQVGHTPLEADERLTTERSREGL